MAHVYCTKLLFWHDFEDLQTELQSFHDSIVSQFAEETWVQRKPGQKYRKMTNKPWSNVRIKF